MSISFYTIKKPHILFLNFLNPVADHHLYITYCWLWIHKNILKLGETAEILTFLIVLILKSFTS